MNSITKNWKTTVIGVVGAMTTTVYSLITSGTIDIKTLLISAAMAGIGVLAADGKNTGV